MWACALLAALFCLISGAPQNFCPSDCRCSSQLDGFTAKCRSLDFLSKHSSTKHLQAIDALQVVNGSVVSGAKLHKMPNLRSIDLSRNELSDVPNLTKLSALIWLNLSSNSLQTLNVKVLPPNLETLDLSRNNIKTIPNDLVALKHIRYVNFVKNPLHCTCGSLEVRDTLLQRNVVIEPVICAAPEKYKKKSWLTVECDDVDSSKKVERMPKLSTIENDSDMMGDQPYDPEADSGELLGAPVVSSAEESENDNFEEDYMPVSSVAPAEESRANEEDFSGSGDGRLMNVDVTESPATTQEAVTEDDDFSGDGEFTTPSDDVLSVLKPQCLYKPCPDESSTENGTISDPIASFSGDLQEIMKEISGEDTTTLAAPLTTEAHDDTVVAVRVPELDQAPEEGNKGEIKIEESEPKQSSTPTYILLIILLAIVIVLLIYAVMTKQKAKRKYRRANLNPPELEKPSNNDVEMKLLSEENNKPQNGFTEATPLVNGNADNQNDPDIRKNSTNGKLDYPPTYMEPTESDGEVELRKRNDQSGLLTPEAQRVTIRVSELPDSLPKTPILVNRHISTDGRTITTPSYDQRFK